jgi:hypothetical protein
MARARRVPDRDLVLRFSHIQDEVNTMYSDRFRRIWVSFTRIGKVRVDVLVTLFPLEGPYTMRSIHNLTAEDVSLEDVVGLIDG